MSHLKEKKRVGERERKNEIENENNNENNTCMNNNSERRTSASGCSPVIDLFVRQVVSEDLLQIRDSSRDFSSGRGLKITAKISVKENQGLKEREQSRCNEHNSSSNNTRKNRRENKVDNNWPSSRHIRMSIGRRQLMRQKLQGIPSTQQPVGLPLSSLLEEEEEEQVVGGEEEEKAERRGRKRRRSEVRTNRKLLLTDQKMPFYRLKGYRGKGFCSRVAMIMAFGLMILVSILLLEYSATTTFVR